METLVWIAQGILAAVFLGAGLAKLATPYEKLSASDQMAWTADFSQRKVKAIGLVEVLASIGLILPSALEIAPVLTPVAAVGLVLVMAGAARTHLKRGENQMIIVNLVLALLAIFVAVERFGPHSL